jgi:hypothetical protein
MKRLAVKLFAHLFLHVLRLAALVAHDAASMRPQTGHDNPKFHLPAEASGITFSLVCCTSLGMAVFIHVHAAWVFPETGPGSLIAPPRSRNRFLGQPNKVWGEPQTDLKASQNPRGRFGGGSPPTGRGLGGGSPPT